MQSDFAEPLEVDEAIQGRRETLVGLSIDRGRRAQIGKSKFKIVGIHEMFRGSDISMFSRQKMFHRSPPPPRVLSEFQRMLDAVESITDYEVQ